MKKPVLYFLWLLSMLALYLGVILVFGTLTDYQPAPVLPAQSVQHSEKKIITDSVVSFLIWNMGYAGLGEEATFFYNRSTLYAGNMMVRPPKNLLEKYFKGTTEAPKRWKADYYLFQEVDFASKRSYYHNQYQALAKNAPGQFAAYFPNFVVKRVPAPLLEPWRAFGAVNSGLTTISAYEPESAQRYQLPGKFAWPTRLFMLDRCLGITRYPMKNGKKLVVINIHNEAFDSKGTIKKIQMGFLKTILLQEYKKGNYVVAGGDWNTCPPFFLVDRFIKGKTPDDYTVEGIDPEFLPEDWRWIYDPTVPTNRANSTPYKKGETFVTLIDFYLVSPNVRVLSVKGIDLQFKDSDHQPVWMEVRLD
jgi:endonuclease/exonuclease/phosphatase family metal-dependent hydrolase